MARKQKSNCRCWVSIKSLEPKQATRVKGPADEAPLEIHGTTTPPHGEIQATIARLPGETLQATMETTHREAGVPRIMMTERAEAVGVEEEVAEGGGEKRMEKRHCPMKVVFSGARLHQSDPSEHSSLFQDVLKMVHEDCLMDEYGFSSFLFNRSCAHLANYA